MLPDRKSKKESAASKAQLNLEESTQIYVTYQ
jgi:hypothetical protein